MSVDPGGAGGPDRGATVAGTGGVLRAGERVLLVDRRGRSSLVRLRDGGRHHTHAGVLLHDELIDAPEGIEVRTDRGAAFVVLRPTLSDVVLHMPRGAQVIYPKDLGPIVLALDLRPGTIVLEAGVGSGALSLALLAAGAQVVGYEVREDFATRAEENVRSLLGRDVPYRVEIRDVYDGISGIAPARIVLDLPEPWRVVPHAAKALAPGGLLVSYLPSIVQVRELWSALARHGFGLCRTSEILERTWHVEGQSVRPDHRMVAHTGFLTVARLLSLPPEVPVDRAEVVSEPTGETAGDEGAQAE